MSSSCESLALLHDGDSYFLDLEVSSEVRLLRVLRDPSNCTGAPVLERWYDLDHATRDAILTQIRRRHKEKLIRVQ